MRNTSTKSSDTGEIMNNDSADDDEPMNEIDDLPVIHIDGIDREVSDDLESVSDEILSQSDIPSDDASLVIEVHSKDVFCVECFHNRWIACGSEDDTAALFDSTVSLTNPVHRITGHNDSVIAVSFSCAGTFLATGDMSGGIVITNVESHNQICPIEDCSDLEWLQWHSSADILFAGCNDGLMWMWLMTNDGVKQRKVFGHGGANACTIGKLLPDGKRLLAGYANGSVHLWILKDSTSSSLTLPSECISVDVHISHPIAIIGTRNGRSYLIGTDNLKVLREFHTSSPVSGESMDGDVSVNDIEEERSIECVAFSRDHPWVAVGTSDGILAIYDTNSGLERHQCSHYGESVVDCRWLSSSDGPPVVLSAYYDGFIRAWDARNGEPIFAVSGGCSKIFAISVISDSSNLKIISACASGKLRFFDVPPLPSA
ncbi:hypothetical protein AB6A40_006765 [Gnathostoma spinigerum]|uniref:Uncharacterized protein n=1 Tax=Gnathostoma spinigerum TaxID=75299 RepID=A0ABD6ELB6_9BILA